jgi:hypothetical protein
VKDKEFYEQDYSEASKLAVFTGREVGKDSLAFW